MTADSHRIADIIHSNETALLAEWIAEQTGAFAGRSERVKETELRMQCQEFLALLPTALRTDGRADNTDIAAPMWEPIRGLLASISRSRTLQGFTPSETATFVFSLKGPLFACLQKEFQSDAAGLVNELWATNTLLDKLGLWTTEVYQKSREEVIVRQQQELLELSTPVVKLWDGVLAVPLIGTLDSARTQTVMETLLQMIVETGSELAIIDITGVPTVDTLTAQHLLKAVAAARLMGADCIISGIRPQIAQTIVHLGVDLTSVITKATLADALRAALQRLNLTVTRVQAKN